jgi:hypothetical protein
LEYTLLPPPNACIAYLDEIIYRRLAVAHRLVLAGHEQHGHARELSLANHLNLLFSGLGYPALNHYEDLALLVTLNVSAIIFCLSKSETLSGRFDASFHAADPATSP